MSSEWKTIEKNPRIKNPILSVQTPTIVSNNNTPMNISKLSEKPDIIKVKETTLEFRNALQQARVKKGYNRNKLAQLINKKQSVIDDLENGNMFPTPQLISKLSTVLGVKLPSLKTKILIDERNSE